MDDTNSKMTVKPNPVRLWLRKNLLLVLTLASVILGVVIGGLLRYSEPSVLAKRLIGFPGDLFMNMLKAMILPLIAASLISGLSQLDGKTSGKLGSRAMMYYALTTTHAVILGIIIVMLIHPGKPIMKEHIKASNEEIEKHSNATTLDKFMDLIRNVFPENYVRAMFSQHITKFEAKVKNNISTMEPKVEYQEGMNVLGIIVFCITMGLVIGNIGKAAKPLADLFTALDLVITKMVFIIMWAGPIGIPSLIAQKMLDVDDLVETATVLGLFILTVIIGLAIQCFITLPLIYFVFTRQNPYKFLGGLGQAVLTALGTSSSAASLPATFRCLHQLGIDSRVTKFVLPVGAMINMDGTALYEAVASIFIAQLNGKEMGIGEVLVVSVTATLASIGAASIPSAGLVTMIIVLTALDLPTNDISLILAIDWFLDRLRTSVNVVGDAFGCGLVHHMLKDNLEEITHQQEEVQGEEHVMAHGIDFNELEKEMHAKSSNNIQIC